MKCFLETNLLSWHSQRSSSVNINKLVDEFVYAVNLSLFHSLRLKKKGQMKSYSIIWHHDVFKFRFEENIAYHEFNYASEEEKASRFQTLKCAQRNLRYALRRCAKSQLKKKIQEIENLKSKDSKEYWRRLYELENTESSHVN